MKGKVLNLKKLVRNVLLLTLIVIGISLFVNNISFSHADVEYKDVYVTNGDTLWSIAKQEKETNLYYDNKDIRYIVNHIKSINNLTSSNLKVNQELSIPTI